MDNFSISLTVRCGMENFKKFVSISHTVTKPISTILGETTDADKSSLMDIRIQISPEIRIRIPGPFLLEIVALAEVCAL